jgi:hypothetical protein
MKVLFSTLLLLAVSMNSVIAANDTSPVKVTAWNDDQVIQSLEFPLDSTVSFKCVNSAQKTKLLVEKNGIQTASCRTSKVRAIVEPSNTTIIADKVEVLRSKKVSAAVDAPK